MNILESYLFFVFFHKMLRKPFYTINTVFILCFCAKSWNLTLKKNPKRWKIRKSWFPKIFQLAKVYFALLSKRGLETKWRLWREHIFILFILLYICISFFFFFFYRYLPNQCMFRIWYITIVDCLCSNAYLT